VIANHISSGSNIVGNLEGAGNYKISGGLFGNISEVSITGATLVVDQDGYIHGDIQYSNLIVIGTINGSINVSGRIEVYPTAIIRGNILYKQLNIHPDAKVNGRVTCCDLDQAADESADVIILHSDPKTGT
jgi:cytoskeletal protein CcmA (bactofilin family)